MMRSAVICALSVLTALPAAAQDPRYGDAGAPFRYLYRDTQQGAAVFLRRPPAATDVIRTVWMWVVFDRPIQDGTSSTDAAASRTRVHCTTYSVQRLEIHHYLGDTYIGADRRPGELTETQPGSPGRILAEAACSDQPGATRSLFEDYAAIRAKATTLASPR
jgi:hypothetical protein